MNCKGKAPCALHAWGSQLYPCPRVCRDYGLSARRLDEKGLFGLLLQSAVDCEGISFLRHVHPCEALALNGVDPTIDFGTNPRLILSAIGQLASPLQTLWVMIALRSHFDEVRFGKTWFSADTQLRAYMSWLTMRCNLLWPQPAEPQIDDKLAVLVKCWDQVEHLSLCELMHPPRWDEKLDAPVTMAAILDLLFREQQHASPVPSICLDHDMIDPETPWIDCPVRSNESDVVPGIEAEFCTVIFDGDGHAPIKLSPFAGTTLGELLKAHEKLVGAMTVSRCVDASGQVLSLSHVLQVGQLINVQLCHPRANVALPEPIPDAIAATHLDEVVSPTITWSQPVEVPSLLKPSIFDIGECSAQAMKDNPEWLCAEPLLGLTENQFLMLSAPQVATPQQLWSIRHQFLKVPDRLAILSKQGPIFSDDEIRFHPFALSQKFVDAQVRFSQNPVKQLVTIDPIITTAWMQDKAFDCQAWGKDHGFIYRQSLPVAAVFLLSDHWVPVSMHPTGDTLQVFVWDADGGNHLKLNQVIETLGLSMGFLSVIIQRDRRMFFTTELCGTLAIAYLHNTLLHVQLPSNHEETEQRMVMYREQFVNSFSTCDITRRPWIWGKGDRAASSTEDLFQAMPTVSTVLTRDQRLDLIVEHQNAVGDDEIRFHIQHIIARYEQIQERRGRVPMHRYHWFEPLIFTCWESSGRTISEQWCARHPDVKASGAQVLTAFLLDDHWFPFWINPHDECLTFHTIDHPTINAQRSRDVCACIGQQLGFSLFALHIIPRRLPPHDMCGAHALMFLAHVVHGAQLPDSIEELSVLHTNMRAAFVEQLYNAAEVSIPVIWGNGVLQQESGLLPKLPCLCPFEALKRGVPDTHAPNVGSVGLTACLDWTLVHRLFHWTSSTLPCPEMPKQVAPAPIGKVPDPTNGMDAAEVLLHISRVQSWATANGQCVDLPMIQVLPTLDDALGFVHEFLVSSHQRLIHVALVHQHWVPMIGFKSAAKTRLFVPSEVLACFRELCSMFQDVIVQGVEHLSQHNLCGAQAIDIVSHLCVEQHLQNRLRNLNVGILNSRLWLVLMNLFFTHSAVLVLAPRDP